MTDNALVLTADAYTGKKFGKYDVLCRLSTGGMSVIFLAFQRGLAGFKKLVVLKQILPDIKGEEEFVRMFLDEAKITAAFTHPNIAHVYDLDISNGELFLAMEFIEGATLVELYEACRAVNLPIPVGLTLAAVRDTALALHYAHTFTDHGGKVQSIIHRDVAEKNVMLTYDGVIKLLDFGIAKRVGRANRTEVGTLKGTSGYMSPEQILGESLDPRSDVFSLGIVLHQCLTGVRLFYGKTPSQEIEAALKTTVHPPSRQNSDVPPELDKIVLKALERERKERYDSALEFARAIDASVGHLLWGPEKRSDFVLSHFASRREKVRNFISEMQHGFEHTGEFPIRQLMNAKSESQSSEGRKTTRVEEVAATLLGHDNIPEVNASQILEIRPSSLDHTFGETGPTTQPLPASRDPLSVPLEEPSFHDTTRPVTVANGSAPVSIAKRLTRDEVPDRKQERRPKNRASAPPRALLFGVGGAAVLLLVLLGLLFTQEQRRRPAGRLILNTRPASMVFFQAQELGTTPLNGVKLPVGRQTLRLVGPDRRARLLTVDIQKELPARVDVFLETLPAE